MLSPDLVTPGSPVYQPGLKSNGSRRVAVVKTVKRVVTSGKNSVDVALAVLDQGVRMDPRYPGLGPLTGIAEPTEMESVVKFGQASLGTSGFFDSVDTDVTVPFEFMGATFTTVYVFVPGGFAGRGDSGSLIVDPATRKVIGLLFAVAPLRVFAIPMDAVVAALPGIKFL